MKCLECGRVIDPYNWKYCSITCRNRAVSRIPRGTFKRTNMICHECGDNYVIKNSKKNLSKYCSRKCQGTSLARIRVEKKSKK